MAVSFINKLALNKDFFIVQLRTIAFLTTLFPASVLSAPVTLILSNGDQLKGYLESRTEQSVVITHELLGQLTIANNKISQIRTDFEGLAQRTPVIEPVPLIDEPPESIAEAETEAEVVAEALTMTPEDNGFMGTGWLVGWDRRLDAGLAGSAGKSKNNKLNVAFIAELNNERTRINWRNAYYRSTSEGELSDHSFYSSINRDWLRPQSQWFSFAGGRLDLDEFRDWDYRVAGNAGLGYEFVDTENWLLLGRSGLGFSQTFGGDREDFTPEGLIGVETRWKINSTQRIAFANTLYPSLEDMGEYRNLTSLDWILDLNTIAGIALRVGLTNEYDSETESGINKNDFKYTVSLSWKM
ncbi:DUF481 domain-containing protein [Methylophaga lonarensis]|uniref:DUF481 domain-containing protein n=1 Tax=Methylophaga lonarensis TaxID=999151 RepID=UPI003D26CE63